MSAKILLFRQAVKLNDKSSPIQVSIVICAKNEAENLRHNLPLILSQKYFRFEVIVVNDGSTDESLKVLQSFQTDYTFLKVINITPEEKIGSGKKQALTAGIQVAQYQYLLLTDADCYPTSHLWLEKMIQNLSEKNKLTLGISPYEDKKNLVSDVVTYETTTTILQYIGLALWKLPYMGVGRNIAYTKNLFEETKGFTSHTHISSGDDDLFVQEAIANTQVNICIDKDAKTFSPPPATWRAWWKQKIRHYTTGYNYQMKHQFLLGFFLSSKLLVYLSLFGLLLLEKNEMTALIFFLLYECTIHSVYFLIGKKLQVSTKWHKTFYLDILFVFTLIAQGIHSFFTKKIQWK
ncbi:MAG: glycosyltransferase [Chitinophagales bacterium]|nr:glycosyltransferase [Chitinophagales bacterium]